MMNLKWVSGKILEGFAEKKYKDIRKVLTIKQITEIFSENSLGTYSSLQRSFQRYSVTIPRDISMRILHIFLDFQFNFIVMN